MDLLLQTQEGEYQHMTDGTRYKAMEASGRWYNMDISYDEMTSSYDFHDFAFLKLKERYRTRTGQEWKEKHFDMFRLRDENGKLTNAGALLADDSPIRHSRLFCTRWNGLDKSGGMFDALDGAEYSGSLISLFNYGCSFINHNMRIPWRMASKAANDNPEYFQQSVEEALVNALVHRDYTVLGSEVHIDMYDDRLTITSPGGMPAGKPIQERDISSITTICRNPVIADVLEHLGYMNRKGNGLLRIIEPYASTTESRKLLRPQFHSDSSTFQVTLYNMDCGMDV